MNRCEGLYALYVRDTHRKKPPPVPGALVTIVYDRDQPQRNRKYPLAVVKLDGA